ncbi:MAG: hypothetical protein PHX21_10730 [bacterium]|nr:hypothetical protein [bacterium]
MEVLLNFAATKVIAVVIGVVTLLGTKSKDVAFTKPQVVVVSDTIYVSTVLKNAFPKGLKEIILSGTPVNLRATFQNKETSFSKEITHNVKYNIAEKNFLITISESDTSFLVKEMGNVEQCMTNFNKVKLVCPDKNINMVGKAYMDPVKMEAIGGKEFELIAFWDYQMPSLKFIIKK